MAAKQQQKVQCNKTDNSFTVILIIIKMKGLMVGHIGKLRKIRYCGKQCLSTLKI